MTRLGSSQVGPDQALDRRLDRVLSQIHPEFSGFRDFQRRALRAVVRGFDAFLVAPTSAGKTLVLEVLPYLLKGTVIVVLPLVALQSMMAKELALTKHLTVLCECQASAQEVNRALASSFKNYHVVLCSAETALSREWLNAFTSTASKVRSIVVDEAHCVEQWYVHFRAPMYFLLTVRTRVGVFLLTPLSTWTSPCISSTSHSPSLRFDLSMGSCTSLCLRSMYP